MQHKFYCAPRTHFVPNGKPVVDDSLVVCEGVIGRARNVNPAQAFFTPQSSTQGVWVCREYLVSGDWVDIESCENGGQI